MTKDQEKRTLATSVVLMIAPLLIIPLGLCLGTLVAIISDFGLWHTMDNIRLNPATFVKQYGWIAIFNGWFSVAIVIASAAIAGVRLIRHSKA